MEKFGKTWYTVSLVRALFAFSYIYIYSWYECVSVVSYGEKYLWRTNIYIYILSASPRFGRCARWRRAAKIAVRICVTVCVYVSNTKLRNYCVQHSISASYVTVCGVCVWESEDAVGGGGAEYHIVRTMLPIAKVRSAMPQLDAFAFRPFGFGAVANWL